MRVKCQTLQGGANVTSYMWGNIIRVHGTPMECVESDVYLGDVISASGANTQNIKARISRGKGIALLLGQSLFLSSILTYSESW